MVYKQFTQHVKTSNLFPQADFEEILPDAERILDKILDSAHSGELPIISLVNEGADLAEICEFSEMIRGKFNNLVVLGTVGSTLCGQALSALRENKFGQNQDITRVIYMQNIDPASWSEFLATLDFEKTAFLTISKSGTSIETLTQFLTCLEAAQHIDIKEHFFSITMPSDSPLRRISESYGIKIMEHDPNVGGRFSIFSLVGLIPAAVAGADIAKIRKGGQNFLKNQAQDAAISASIHAALMRNNIWQNVLLTYPDTLFCFNTWYRQIWAESLGKNGTGSTPIRAMGTIDQHSQMQLYLAGRKDKFFTYITLACKGQGASLKKVEDAELEYLSGKQIGDIFEVEQRATISTMAEKGLPVREIALAKLDEETLGMLVMHLMLETIITARLLGVNPYDQPAVEDGKNLTRKILKSGGL